MGGRGVDERSDRGKGIGGGGRGVRCEGTVTTGVARRAPRRWLAWGSFFLYSACCRIGWAAGWEGGGCERWGVLVTVDAGASVFFTMCSSVYIQYTCVFLVAASLV